MITVPDSPDYQLVGYNVSPAYESLLNAEVINQSLVPHTLSTQFTYQQTPGIFFNNGQLQGILYDIDPVTNTANAGTIFGWGNSNIWNSLAEYIGESQLVGNDASINNQTLRQVTSTFILDTLNRITSSGTITQNQNPDYSLGKLVTYETYWTYFAATNVISANHVNAGVCIHNGSYVYANTLSPIETINDWNGTDSSRIITFTYTNGLTTSININILNNANPQQSIYSNTYTMNYYNNSAVLDTISGTHSDYFVYAAEDDYNNTDVNMINTMSVPEDSWSYHYVGTSASDAMSLSCIVTHELVADTVYVPNAGSMPTPGGNTVAITSGTSDNLAGLVGVVSDTVPQIAEAFGVLSNGTGAGGVITIDDYWENRHSNGDNIYVGLRVTLMSYGLDSNANLVTFPTEISIYTASHDPSIILGGKREITYVTNILNSQVVSTMT